jgi:hypothetical protein
MGKLEYEEIMRAELKVDVYDGPNCDQHKKYWNAYAEGDKQDDDFSEDINLSLKQFPPGTKIVVSVPLCPECYLSAELCDCGFDWKNWVEEQYS